jgi:hypothetical protein
MSRVSDSERMCVVDDSDEMVKIEKESIVQWWQVVLRSQVS